MVFLIQNTQNRGGVQTNLDEIILPLTLRSGLKS
ncbi:hypothetical protein [Rhizobium pisi]